jgi:hypothetical protein
VNLPTLRTGLALPHPEPLAGAKYSVAELMPGDRTLALLDQRRLPRLEHYDMVTKVDDVAAAISNMAVRGAPASSIVSAYGMVLAAVAAQSLDAAAFTTEMAAKGALLRATRPAAVNLASAVQRMEARAAAVAAQAGIVRVTELANEAGRLVRVQPRRRHRPKLEARGLAPRRRARRPRGTRMSPIAPILSVIRIVDGVAVAAAGHCVRHLWAPATA